MQTLFRLMILMAIVMSACGSEPKPILLTAPVTTQPTRTAIPKSLNLVIISGAFAGNNIPQLYEKIVQEELGGEVNTYSWIKVNEKPDEFLENMRLDTELRSAIAKADIILFSISPNWSNSAELDFRLGLCGGEDNQECMRKATAQVKCDWAGIVETMAELRTGRPVVFHVIFWGEWIFPAAYGNQVTTGQISTMNSYYNEFQTFQSSTPGIQSVLVFPGKYGETPEEYIRKDWSHQLSEAGSAAAVELLREIGFEPTVLEKMEIGDANLDCASTSK